MKSNRKANRTTTRKSKNNNKINKRQRRNRLPLRIFDGGAENKTDATLGISLDGLSTIAIASAGTPEVSTISVGGNPLALNTLGTYTIDHIIPDVYKNRMADEFMSKGIAYKQFKVKDIVIRFDANRQTMVNLSNPFYFKIDNQTHSINDLTSIKPNYIKQNQSMRVIYKFPKIDEQITTGSQNRGVWQPVGIDELWAEINKVYISCYCYAVVMNPLYASVAPIWNMQITIHVVFSKDDLENIELKLRQLANFRENNNNSYIDQIEQPRSGESNMLKKSNFGSGGSLELEEQ